MKTLGIKYYSLLESSGYGLAALSYINALLDSACPIQWVPLVLGERGYQPWYQSSEPRRGVESLLGECLQEQSQINRLLACLEPVEDYQAIVMHLVPEYWPYLLEEGQRHIGYTVWETTRLPKHFPDLINQVDKVLVPATFNQPIFERSGVTVPIKVVPHILNHVPAPSCESISAAREFFETPDENYVFYSINAWTARKSMWSLIHGYLKSFTNNDPVSLVIKTSPTGPRNQNDPYSQDTRLMVEEIVGQYSEPAHIKVVSDKISLEAINALHQIGDCFVSSSHSEGWGLGMFEAAGAGNPVIATNWGGHVDFLPNDSNYLTPHEFTSVIDAQGGSSYSADQEWSAVCSDDISKKFKRVFSEQNIAKVAAKEQAKTLIEKFNSTNVGKQLYQAIYGK